MSERGECRACGAGPLRAHLRVAGAAGPRGLIPTTDEYGTALADIVRCTRCGHMQLERFPADSVLEREYGAAASSDYLAEERGQRETARRLLARIERRLPRAAAGAPHPASRRLADLGCWTGVLLDEARRRGWEVAGVEPSEWAARHARERLGLGAVQNVSLQSARLAPAGFEAIVMADVIEHLVEPGAALERARAALAPGGVLCLVLPDAGSTLARLLGRRWWSVLPTHVQYFTRDSLTTMLARSGFEAVELATAPKAFSAGYYVDRLAGYSRAPARALRRLAGALGVAERIVAPDFRDRMLVLATPRAGVQRSSVATARSASSTP